MSFNKAIKAMNTRSIAPTFTASFTPSIVPLVIDNRIFPFLFFDSIFISYFILFDSSGNIILEMATAPGAAITDAVNK